LVWVGETQAIVFEPRMAGLVLLADPPTCAHLRFRADLRDGDVPHLWYWDRRGLGSVRLLTRDEIEQQLGPHRLGPDALTVDAELLRVRLGRRGTPIKVALLDQSAVAGIGNLYASEILHDARIDPRVKCHTLVTHHWRRLAKSVVRTLEGAIRYEGSTLADGTYRTALNESGGYQNRHRVYGRAGEICTACGRDQILRIVQAQRSTFFCLTCQTEEMSGTRRKPPAGKASSQKRSRINGPVSGDTSRVPRKR
jgi:formamidopyrimidine-DNA glycosylase